VKTHFLHFRPCGEKSPPPLLQGQRIAFAETFRREQPETVLFPDFAQVRLRRQKAAGKDEALDEVRPPALGREPILGDGDRLQDTESSGPKPVADRLEIPRQIILSDRLDHLDSRRSDRTAL
jgi:hypothetical protein